MDEHEKILKDYGRALGEMLRQLLIPEAGIPRPIIRLNNEMPLLLPVNQDTLKTIREFTNDAKREFHPATLVLHIQPYQDPYQRQTLTVSYPYNELAQGEDIKRIDDPRPIRLARLVVTVVPSSWRAEAPLELLLQARAAHRRHGDAIGVGPTIPLRVPRQEIPGKETGI